MSNTVTIVGTLGRDPELRYTTGGRAVVNFSIADNRRYQSNGEWKEETCWHNVTAWGDLGENCAASLAKGNRAIVTGRLQQREYEDKDGNKRSSIDVIADSVGPDLRWATVEVTKTERVQGEGAGNAGRSDAPPLPDEEPF